MLANTGSTLALPYKAHPLVSEHHQWRTGTGHHHICNAHHAQWGTGQYPDLSIVALQDKLASIALMSSKFKVSLGYLVSLKLHSQKIKIAERNVLVPGKPGPPAGSHRPLA